MGLTTRTSRAAVFWMGWPVEKDYLIAQSQTKWKKQELRVSLFCSAFNHMCLCTKPTLNQGKKDFSDYCSFSIQAWIFQWGQTMELERSLRVWMWNQLLKTNQVGLNLLHQCLLTLNIMRTVFLWGTPLPPKKCWSPHLWLLFLAPGYGQILTLIYETKLSTSLPMFINKLSMQMIWLVHFYWIFSGCWNFCNLIVFRVRCPFFQKLTFIFKVCSHLT